ncbi:MAG: hypothetical protein OXH23_12440 [bacterium]|nr:hypothetical protein [bacterium]
MPRPTTSQVHTNKPLSNFLISHMQSMSQYVTRRAVPRVPVMHRSDTYYNEDRGDTLRDTVRVRAPGTLGTGSDVGIDTGSYYCEWYSDQDKLPIQTEANADPSLRRRRGLGKVRQLAQKMNTKLERTFATTCFEPSAGVWTAGNVSASSGNARVSSRTAANRWDGSSADIVADIQYGINAILDGTGKLPDIGVLHYKTAAAIAQNDDIVDRWKHTHQGGDPTMDFITSLFPGAFSKGWIIGSAIYNSADEGAADAFLPCLTDNFLMMHLGEGTTIDDSEGAARIFEWINGPYVQGLGPEMGSSVREWWSDDYSSTIFEANGYWDISVIDGALGFLWRDVLS